MRSLQPEVTETKNADEHGGFSSEFLIERWRHDRVLRNQCLNLPDLRRVESCPWVLAVGVMDVGSLWTEASQLPGAEGSRRTVASRSPGAECPTWAAGTSRLKLSVEMITPETTCWFACVIALSLQSNHQPRKRFTGKRPRIARRVREGEDEMASSWKNSHSCSLHRCARRRGFTHWSTPNETSHLSTLPNVAFPRWHFEGNTSNASTRQDWLHPVFCVSGISLMRTQ